MEKAFFLWEEIPVASLSFDDTVSRRIMENNLGNQGKYKGKTRFIAQRRKQGQKLSIEDCPVYAHEKTFDVKFQNPAFLGVIL
jgi:hypothetical protein